MGFRIITKSLQENFEKNNVEKQDKTPDICGYYGRACRQMDKSEGCNGALCSRCTLGK